MRNLKKKLAIAAVAAGVGATALVVANPASANSTGSGVVVGSGTISPGLTANAQPTSVTFGGTLVAAGANGTSTNGSGVYTCSFSGTGNDSIAIGNGNVTGSCSGSAGSTSASIHYQRVGGDVVLTGTASGTISGAVAGDCSFEATTATLTAYQLQCALTIH